MEHENEQLIAGYAAAFEEWAASEDAELWDRTSGDGLEEEPPAEEWVVTDER